jgi:uncharacterized protein involved in exopolysaccharide biosynthesis
MPELEDDREDPPEARHYLRVLRERPWIIILSVVVVVGAALAISYTATPMYRASATIVYQKNNLDRALFGAQVFENELPWCVANSLRWSVRPTPPRTA